MPSETKTDAPVTLQRQQYGGLKSSGLVRVCRAVWFEVRHVSLPQTELTQHNSVEDEGEAESFCIIELPSLVALPLVNKHPAICRA